jgi:CSLREA domain-containing protein
MPRFPRAYNYVRPLLVLSLFLLLIGLPGGKENFWNYLLPGASAATTFTVNSTGDGADNNLGDGLCNDGSGSCTLRAAIQQASVLFGTDNIAFNLPAASTITLNTALPTIGDSLNITGPGANSLTIRRSNAGGTPNFRIFTINSGNTVAISGLTVTNGRTADGIPGGGFAPGYGGQGDNGGGILSNGALTLTDVVVTGNRTGDGGAGTSGTGGPGGFGGGVYAGGSLTMTNVSVSNNTTGNGAIGNYGGGGGNGGGIYFLGSALSMTNCLVSSNTSGNGVSGTSGSSSGDGGSAGGIEVELPFSLAASTVILTKVVITGNHAGDGAQPISSGGGRGGGILLFPGVSTTMTNCSVTNNNSGQGGTGFASQGGFGGGIDNGGPLTMTGSTVSGNFTKGPSAGGGGLGAGIFNNNTLTMTNSTVSGNHTDLDFGRGGGIFNNGGTLSLINCTVTDNTAYSCCSFQNGQGVHNSGTANIRNTIIAGNGSATTPDVTGNFNSQGHNLIGKATFGSSNGNNGDESGFVNGNNGDQVGTLGSPLSALLGPLADNGGPTLTHSPLAGSLVLDAGDNCVAQASHCGDSRIPQLITDQRGSGFNRIVDGPDADTAATVDIGAFEQQASLGDIANASTNEDTQLLVPFDVGDRSTITSITASSSNPTLVPNDSAHLTVTDAGTTEVITINPASNLFGSTDITVTVNRSGGVSSSKTFSVTVNSVNDAPSFTKGADRTVNENDGAQTVNGWATNISPGAPNESAQALTFQITNNSNASLFSAGPAISPSGVLTYTPAPGVSGSATITLSLKDDGGTANGGTDVSAAQTFTITVREGGTISLNSSSFGVTETNGTIAIPVIRTGGSAGTASVLFSTSDGTATNADYTPVSQTVIFNDGEISKTVNVPITDDLFKESNETINITLSNVGGSAQLGGQTTAVITIFDNDPAGGYVRFSTDNYNAPESGGLATITVQRIGETAQAVDISYTTTGGSTAPCSTTNGGASSRCDFTLALGTLHFAPGDTSKTFSVLISQDNYVEGPETLGLGLSSLTSSAQLATPSAATLTILDDAVEPSKNPVDDAEAFVRQHYHDFLNREPDAGGIAFWTNQITECQQPGATCSAELRRINVSAAFFLSIEFQETGYLVERLYKTAYANASGISNFGTQHTLAVPIIRLNEFLTDSQEISRGLVVGTTGWEQVLENNKTAFTQAFVQRSRFTSTYSTFLSPASFVDQLIARAGITFSAAERTSLINEFGGASNTTNTIARAKVLRRIAESEALNQIEKSRAFVLMQFFGYLRRNPNDPQDTDYTGYDFWLTKLNEHNGNYIEAEMVKAFLDSTEYRARFGP